MGLANLVPGISGGTMLLASGVYPAFVNAIAELTTLRFRLRSIAILGVIAGTAMLAILLLAGATRALVLEQRWVMYSLFIGMTLGGLPIVWRLARPVNAAALVWAGIGLAGMAAMTWVAPGGGAGERSFPLLFLAGAAGAAAMILPGVSGGYLLLVLGQYVIILGAVDGVKLGLVEPLLGGGAPQWPMLQEALAVLIPVGLGVATGVVAISNLVRWTLERFPKPTLGLLLGLLLGAVIGLWPFQEAVGPEAWPPEAFERYDPEEVDEWPLERFAPSAGQMAASLLLIAGGFLLTTAVGRLGGGDPEA